MSTTLFNEKKMKTLSTNSIFGMFSACTGNIWMKYKKTWSWKTCRYRNVLYTWGTVESEAVAAVLLIFMFHANTHSSVFEKNTPS